MAVRRALRLAGERKCAEECKFVESIRIINAKDYQISWLIDCPLDFSLSLCLSLSLSHSRARARCEMATLRWPSEYGNANSGDQHSPE